MIREKFEEIRKSLGNLPGAFRIVWEADSSSTIRLASLTVIAALLPVTQAYIGKLIVDSVVKAVSTHTPGIEALREILPYLLTELALFAAGSFLAQTRRLAEQVLDQRAGHHITEQIIRKALTLEIRYFEDSKFYDNMQNARREAEYKALAIINNSFLLVQNTITLFSFVFILFAMSPIIALVLFGATIPSFAVQTRFSKMKFRMQSWRSPETRMITYLEQILTMNTTVKEIRLFGLGDELLNRFNSIFHKIFTEDMSLAKRRLLFSYLWGLLSTLSFYGCYAWIIYLTVLQRITLGDMTLYLGAVRQSQGSFQGILDNVSRLYENGLFMQNLFSFLSLPGMNPTPSSKNWPATDTPGIHFDNVTYRYPDADLPALENFSLHIKPGERFAIVGENGSGKTTLIKLLSRLYEPADGAIRLDGVDLRDMSLDQIYARMGVIFQDFVRYQLSVRENIGFGDIAHLSETERILGAVHDAGADSLLADMPEGLETSLGHQFRRGRELSGGEWQKIALARSFMRSAEILILDEPTSALDAQKEFEIFERFRSLTAGRTAILISHRFSTVRMADRIAVLEHGKLVELGSHDELMKLGGKYARLFELQARGYR